MDVIKPLTVWFYRRETPYAMALVRILLPLGMLLTVLPRWAHVRELYSADGAPAPLWELYGHTGLFPILPPAAAVALFTTLTFCLVTACAGWKSRFSWFVVMVLYPYFGLVDSLGSLTKYTVIATHLAFLLMVSSAGEVWSVDAWLKQQGGSRHRARPPRFAVWPQRLMQLFICLVYLGAASTKVHTPGYFEGEQLFYWMLTNVNSPNPLGEWLSQYPLILIIFSHVTILWEVLFLFLVWHRPWRLILLSFGIVFHVMTYFMLGLFVFPMIYLSAYPAFMHNDQARKVGDWFARQWRRLGSRSSVGFPRRWNPAYAGTTAFLAVLMLLAALGVTAEARMDVYGERGEAGPIALQPLSPDRVDELLRNDTTLRPQDKVFTFQIGTTIVGDVLVDRQREFQHGEILVAQCRLIRPHEDLWVEFSLYDADNRIINVGGEIVPREQIRTTYAVPVSPALAPGEYSLVVKIDRQVAGRRRFVIHGPGTSS